MKFNDYKEITTDQYGFHFVKNNIMVGTEERRCLVCGSPTKYIEVCSEAHFCSDKCVKEFDKQVATFEEIDMNVMNGVENNDSRTKN